MARELNIKVVVDNSQAKPALSETERGVKAVETSATQADKAVGQFGVSVASAAVALGGMLVVDKVLQFADAIVEFSDRMQDMSQRTGFGVETLQALNLVAIGAGTSVDSITEAVTRLSARLENDDTSAVHGMEALGLNTQKFLQLSPEERLFQVADAASKVGDENVRNAALLELFGRKFQELIPVMNAQLREMAANTRGVIPQDTIDKLARFHDGLETLSVKLKAATVDSIELAMHGFDLNAKTAADLTREIERLDKAADDFIKTQLVMLDTSKQWDLAHKDQILTNGELKIVTGEMNDKIKESIKAHEDATRAVEKSEAAYRQFTNFIEERYIEDIKRQNEAAEEWAKRTTFAHTTVQAGMIESSAALQNLTEKTGDELAQQVVDWELWQRAVHDDMARNQHDMIAHVVTLKELWGQFNHDLQDSSLTTTDAIFRLYDGMSGKLVGLFDRHFGGHGFLSNILHSGLSTLLGPAGPLSGLISKGIEALGNLAIEGAKKIWHSIQGIFGTDEEAREVNPKRDKFLSQFGGPGTGPGSGFNELAVMLSNITGEPNGSHFFQDLISASKMDSFRSAAQSIVDILTANGISASMNFGRGGMVPMTGAALVHQGEGVLTPQGVAAAGGPAGVSALNNGGGNDAIVELTYRLDRHMSELPLLIRDALMKAATA